MKRDQVGIDGFDQQQAQAIALLKKSDGFFLVAFLDGDAATVAAIPDWATNAALGAIRTFLDRADEAFDGN
jgi:hypothetical protein